jgi:hypothetical protein
MVQTSFWQRENSNKPAHLINVVFLGARADLIKPELKSRIFETMGVCLHPGYPRIQLIEP